MGRWLFVMLRCMYAVLRTKVWWRVWIEVCGLFVCELRLGLSLVIDIILPSTLLLTIYFHQ